MKVTLGDIVIYNANLGFVPIGGLNYPRTGLRKLAALVQWSSFPLRECSEIDMGPWTVCCGIKAAFLLRT
jgi:hypothetical protein